MTAIPLPAIEAAAATLLRGGSIDEILTAAVAAATAAERQRCAALLTAGTPLGFLRRHGLEPGAGARPMLEAAAAEILAAGEGDVRGPVIP